MAAAKTRGKAAKGGAESGVRWLLLIHQIPPKPDYLRVKIRRRLQRLGAVAIKNSVYALPRSDQANEDLQWVLREIVEGGGDGTICEARLVDGLSDAQVEGLFREASDADFAQLVEQAKGLARAVRAARQKPAQRAELQAELARLRKRFSEIVALDFFGAPLRASTDELLADLEARLREREPGKGSAAGDGAGERVRGRTWVTRGGLGIDRMASAWLIRRFIDDKARFKFVSGKTYAPGAHEVRFDMFEAEHTHEGDRCTFEVLVQRFALDQPGLRALAQIVHDIDLKDSKFGRPETAGIDRLIAGVALAHAEDERRLERAQAIFDDLYVQLQRERA